MKSIYIHIGTHKTGSSAIQRALQLAQFKLAGENILFIPRKGAPECLIDNVRVSSFSEKQIQDGRDYFAKWINKGDDNSRYIFSHEDLCGYPFKGYKNTSTIANAVRKMLPDIPVKIIVYLRRQDYFVESFYNMRIRAGGYCTFTEFRENVFHSDQLYWDTLVASYADVFGKENIIVRQYDKAYLPGNDSIIIDFANCVNSDTLKNITLAREYNTGITQEALEVIRISNEYLDLEESQLLREFFVDVFSRQPFSHHAFFTPEERREYLAQFSESNNTIAHEYLKKDTLFPEYIPEEEVEIIHGNLTAESVAKVLTLAIADVKNAQREPVTVRWFKARIYALIYWLERKGYAIITAIPFTKKIFQKSREKKRAD